MYKRKTRLNCWQCWTGICGSQLPIVPVILTSWYLCLWALVILITGSADLYNQDSTVETLYVTSEARTQKTFWFPPCCIRSLALGEASLPVVRTWTNPLERPMWPRIEAPCQQPAPTRQWREWTLLDVDAPFLAKLSDDCSLNWRLVFNSGKTGARSAQPSCSPNPDLHNLWEMINALFVLSC